MLSPTTATLRLFLHVLAATVWVGGQLTLAGLLPSLRALGPDAPRRIARAFSRIAWPAFAVVVLTGVWNLMAVDIADTSTSYQVTVFVKVVVVAASGISAAVHAGARSKVAVAVGGAVAGLTAIAAVFLGVLLQTGT
jgi:putative copper export protein